jgi:hypothetical protein
MRVVLRSVMPLPQFWSAPLANALDVCPRLLGWVRKGRRGKGQRRERGRGVSLLFYVPLFKVCVWGDGWGWGAAEERRLHAHPHDTRSILAYEAVSLSAFNELSARVKSRHPRALEIVFAFIFS